MNIRNAIIGIIALAGFAFAFSSHTPSLGATVLFPTGGGTGTSTAPTYGKLLVGNAQGTYTLTATSSLGLKTTNVVEGTNLYFTNGRAQSALAGLYEVPLTFSTGLTRSTNTVTCNTANGSTFGCLTAANWTTFNGKQDALTLTTTGSSGAATLVGATLNIPQYSAGAGTGNVSTSTGETAGNLAYWTSTNDTPALLGKVATTTLSATSPLSLSQPVVVIGSSASALSIDTSGSWTGNAGTATALAADGADCSAGSFPLGVNASGAVVNCTDAWTEAENTAANYEHALTFSGPFSRSSNTISWIGLATTSQPASSNLLVSNGTTGVYGVATSSIGVSGPITFSGTSGAQIGGSTGTFGCATCALTTRTLTAGAGLTGGGDLSADRTFAIDFTRANTWSGLQTITNASTSQLSVSTKLYTGNLTDAQGEVITFDNLQFVPTTAGINLGTSMSPWANLFSTRGTLTNASSTHLTAATSLQIPTGSSQAPTVAGYIAHDTTDNQLKLGDGTATAVFDQRRFLTFAYSTTTAMTGTTTLLLGTAPAGLTFTKAQCYTDAGTMNVQFKYGTTPTLVTPMFNASTTIGTVSFTANNTPAAGNTIKVDIGTPATSPTTISCTATATVTGT
jgi:hypothetical protein